VATIVGGLLIPTVHRLATRRGRVVSRNGENLLALMLKTLTPRGRWRVMQIVCVPRYQNLAIAEALGGFSSPLFGMNFAPRRCVPWRLVGDYAGARSIRRFRVRELTGSG